jgi:hypothetical protein
MTAFNPLRTLAQIVVNYLEAFIWRWRHDIAVENPEVGFADMILVATARIPFLEAR